MISYEIYKVIHLVSLLIFFCACGAQLFRPIPSRLLSIMIGVTSFTILVGGMGLMARIGISHGTIFPTWIYFKLFIWLALSIMIPVGVRKFGERRQRMLIPTLVLGLVAVIIAVYKFQ